MLAGAEDFYQRDIRLPDPVEPNRRQTVIRKEVRREGALHSISIRF
jgi:hypothetical protein